ERWRTVVSAADELLPQLPERYRAFFNDNLCVQARFMFHATETVLYLAQALASLPDLRAAYTHVLAGADAFQNARDALSEAEHGRFVSWYQTDRDFWNLSIFGR